MIVFFPRKKKTIKNENRPCIVGRAPFFYSIIFTKLTALRNYNIKVCHKGRKISMEWDMDGQFYKEALNKGNVNVEENVLRYLKNCV